MSSSYPIPAGEARVELIIKNSRFIGRAAYTPSTEAAKAFIEQVKREEPNYSHAVYAFAVGHGATVTHGMSDAGEPSGTAGRPTLAVVKGSNVGDVTVVTIRYFGGTKLGTGGLVKAYTETAQLTFQELPLVQRIEKRVVKVMLAYGYYEQCLRLIEQHGGEVMHEEFAADVTLTARFVESDVPHFATDITDLTHGTAIIEYGELTV